MREFFLIVLGTDPAGVPGTIGPRASDHNSAGVRDWGATAPRPLSDGEKP